MQEGIKLSSLRNKWKFFSNFKDSKKWYPFI